MRTVDEMYKLPARSQADDHLQEAIDEAMKCKETGEEKPFFIEYYTCNPALAEDEPTLGQDPVNKANGKWPSYFMMKCGT